MNHSNHLYAKLALEQQLYPPFTPFFITNENSTVSSNSQTRKGDATIPVSIKVTICKNKHCICKTIKLTHFKINHDIQI